MTEARDEVTECGIGWAKLGFGRAKLLSHSSPRHFSSPKRREAPDFAAFSLAEAIWKRGNGLKQGKEPEA